MVKTGLLGARCARCTIPRSCPGSVSRWDLTSSPGWYGQQVSCARVDSRRSGRTHGAALPPCWYGFAIMGPSGQADFRNCRFEGMYRGFAWQSAPLFDSCEFAGNHYALYCTKKASPLVRNCKFYRNVYAIVADNAAPLLRNNTISQNTIGVYLQAGAQPMAGPNIIAGNTENMRAEPALKGDTTALAIRRLWELMNQLY